MAVPPGVSRALLFERAYGVAEGEGATVFVGVSVGLGGS